MNNKATYNGQAAKRSFHKIRKHLDIVQRILAFNRQRKEIESLGNATLNAVLQSILEVKEATYSAGDREVFDRIEAYRQQLADNPEVVSYEVFNSSATRQIRDIYKIAASPRVWGELLYVLVKNLKAEKVLEIGSNVGVSGTYILHGLKRNGDNFKFITMEGLGQLCQLCEAQFSGITSRSNFDVVAGLYDDTFPQVIARESGFDLAFIDGNHQKEPTLHYFEELKKCSNDRVVFVFDDIYYSEEMREAWEIITRDKSVNFAVDLYKWGIVILDKDEGVHNRKFGIHLSYS